MAGVLSDRSALNVTASVRFHFHFRGAAYNLNIAAKANAVKLPLYSLYRISNTDHLHAVRLNHHMADHDAPWSI